MATARTTPAAAVPPAASASGPAQHRIDTADGYYLEVETYAVRLYTDRKPPNRRSRRQDPTVGYVVRDRDDPDEDDQWIARSADRDLDLDHSNTSEVPAEVAQDLVDGLCLGVGRIEWAPTLVYGMVDADQWDHVRGRMSSDGRWVIRPRFDQRGDRTWELVDLFQPRSLCGWESVGAAMTAASLAAVGESVSHDQNTSPAARTSGRQPPLRDR